MLILENNKVGINIPIIDPRIENKLFFNSTCVLSENLISIFEKTFWAIAEQLEKENLLEDETTIASLTCITINSDEFTIKLNDNQLSMTNSLVVYPIYEWINLTNLTIYVIIIEELCKHYWSIQDDVEVSLKTVEVLERIYTNIELADVYEADWINQKFNKRINEILI